jgi:hypothetical protein
MRKYSHGLGMRANAYVRYERDPKWKRFVAKVGVDDHIVEVNARHMLARYPSIIFKVYLDGELAAQSPIMRVQQQPWSFDVAIEQGTKQIQLVMTDADTRSAYDLGDWVDAGFITAGEERAVDQRETEAER